MKKVLAYYGISPSEKREKLLKSEVAKPVIEEIISAADDAILAEDVSLKASEYMQFFKTGNRKTFENKYFGRRRRCSDLFMAYWLTQDEKYLSPLIDHIFYICDEFTWCIPAHSASAKGNLKALISNVDLFQAETARMFSEIVMCIGDSLPEYVWARMKMEIERRILVDFRDDKADNYWWLGCNNNWGAVCAAGVALSFLIFGEEDEFEKYKNYFVKCLDGYLAGIGNDGGCLEGITYWNYGFENFVILAQIFKVYSGGEIDYFKLPKVHELAKFPQKVRLSESICASIADATEDFTIRAGLISFLKSIYPDVALPDFAYLSRKGNVDSICDVLWIDENYKSDKLEKENFYLADAQWFITRRDQYSFVAKGGTNSQPHNHNDIGSFMITVGEKTLFADLGCAEYVKETHEAATRYTFLTNSSRGHSVPIINGEFQKEGKEFFAQNVIADENSFSLDIEGAYSAGLVNKISRSFSFEEDKIILTDKVTPSEKTDSFVERFISKIPPAFSEGCVDYGIGKIMYDNSRYTVTVQTETFKGIDGKTIITVYEVDFAPVSKEETEFIFTLQM